MAQSIKHSFEKLRDIFPPSRAAMRAARSRPGVVFDPGKCTGCGRCESACASGGNKPGTPRAPASSQVRGRPS